MAENKRTSFFKTVIHKIRQMTVFLLKAIYVLPFFAFGMWLLSLVYLHGFDLHGSISLSRYSKTDKYVYKIIKKKIETIPREHFHMVDDYVERQEANPPVCDVCHGTYAHGKEKKIRALLNLHTTFMDCCVCHVRKNGSDGEGGVITKSEVAEFSWVDNDTGKFKNKVEGEYGKYSAKIYPIKISKHGIWQVYSPINEDDARQFLKTIQKLPQKQIDLAREKLHEGLSKKPVICSDCHQKEGYLDFRKLGFPKQRVDNLVSSEVVGMIDNYKTFYLPSVIDFRGK